MHSARGYVSQTPREEACAKVGTHSLNFFFFDPIQEIRPKGWMLVFLSELFRKTMVHAHRE